MQLRKALRYISNAMELLTKSPIDEDVYLDDKYVKVACGTAYLGVLKAIDEYLAKKGVEKKALPRPALKAGKRSLFSEGDIR